MRVEGLAIAVAPVTEFVMLLNISTKGNPKVDPNTPLASPIQNKTAVSMPKPRQPLSSTAANKDLGMTIAAFSISSAKK